MCFGGGAARAATPKKEFDNRPVTVTGTQTGVDNPKDTAKATETLKIKRQKKEGTYVDPNLTTSEKLSYKKGSGPKTKQQKDNLKAAKTNAQKLASARLKSKFKSSPTGRKTGVA